MSPNKNAISCPCEHAVEGISDNLGIQVVACCYNCLTKLSQIIWLLIMWHIPNLMLQVAPKKKNRTPSGQENEGAKVNQSVYSSVGQEIAPEDIQIIFRHFCESQLHFQIWKMSVKFVSLLPWRKNDKVD